MKSKILGLLAVGLLAGPMAANANIVSFSFTGDGDSSSGIAGESDLVSGTVTFDDAIFAAFDGSTFEATQEYPLASIDFTWSRYSGGTYTDIQIFTRPIVQDTYYPDFRMLTNSTPRTSLTYWNLDSTTPFYSSANMNAGSNASLIFNGALTRPADLLSLLSLQPSAFVYKYLCGQCVRTVEVRFDNIQIESRATAPEPGTLALLVLGLAGLGISRRRKTR